MFLLPANPVSLVAVLDERIRLLAFVSAGQGAVLHNGDDTVHWQREATGETEPRERPAAAPADPPASKRARSLWNREY